MENENFIDSFASKFLTYGRLTLFVLISCASFNWYSSSDPTPANVTTIVNLIGGISFLAWLYAIGHKSNDKLTKHNISLPEFKFFNFGFIAIIASVLTMYFLSKGDVTYGNSTGIVTYHVTYTRPGEVSLFFVASLIFVVFIAAKTLVSAEKRKVADFNDYYKTLLMFAFSWIGLWFIQPRVKSL